MCRCCLVVLIYAALFMEWDDRGSPFDEVRLIPAEQAVDFVLTNVANLTVYSSEGPFLPVSRALSRRLHPQGQSGNPTTQPPPRSSRTYFYGTGFIATNASVHYHGHIILILPRDKHKPKHGYYLHPRISIHSTVVTGRALEYNATVQKERKNNAILSDNML